MEQKKRHVLRAMALGFTNREIAEQLGVSQSTVARICKLIRKDLEYDNPTLKSIANRTLAYYEWLKREVELDRRRAISVKDRTALSRLLADLHEKEIKLLQRMGLIYEKPKEVNIQSIIQKQAIEWKKIYLKKVEEYNRRAQEIGAKEISEQDSEEKKEELELAKNERTGESP